MAGFNIQEFSSSISKHGVAKDNLFMVSITPPPALRNKGEEDSIVPDLRFFCRSVTLPEFDVQTTDYQTQGFGAITRRPQTMTFPILPTVFMVDSNFAVLKFFHRWTQLMVNYDSSGGPISATPEGALPFEMGYKNDYASTVEVVVYSYASESITYTYRFDNAYPIQVGNITESWGNAGEVMTLPVGFTYDKVKVTGAVTGSVLDSVGGANGLLSYLSSINTFAQAIKGLKRPRSIQDAINQVTNISTIIKSF